MRFLRASVGGEVMIPWQRVPEPEPQFTEQRWADDYVTRETRQERMPLIGAPGNGRRGGVGAGGVYPSWLAFGDGPPRRP